MKRTGFMLFAVILIVLGAIISGPVTGLSNTIWLQEGDTVYTNIYNRIHSVTLTDVSKSGDMCGFVVDNETVWIELKQTRTINSVLISVREIIPVHEQLKDKDVCKVIIGGGITEIKTEEDLVVQADIEEINKDEGKESRGEVQENASSQVKADKEQSSKNTAEDKKVAEETPEKQENKSRNPGFWARNFAWIKGILQ